MTDSDEDLRENGHGIGSAMEALLEKEMEVLVTPGSIESLLGKIDAQAKEIDSLQQRLRMYEALQENQHVTEKALCRTQERLRHAIEATRDGIWDYHFPDQKFSLSPRCFTMLGYEYNEIPSTREYWYELLHPDDLERIKEFLEILNRDGISEIENRMKGRSGEWHWVRSHAKVVDRDANNKPLRMVGTISDIHQRRQMEEALRESEAHLKEAQRITHIGSWIWDVAHDSVTWSEELYRIVGLNPDEPAPNYAEHKTMMPHKSWVKYEDVITRTLLTGEPFEIEIEVYHRGNELRWLVSRGAATCSENGKVVRIYGTIQDITEQKRAEEKIRASLKEKEILLKEIHHRVKNNMQVISSLLNLQSNQFQDPQLCDAFEKLKNRIRSIALVHEKLYASDNMSYIAFAVHARNIVNHLVTLYGNEKTNVDLEVDEVRMELSKAIPASLILNELVSNALIHGFPDGSAAAVKVGLHVARGNEVTLEISDNGKGFPEDIDVNESNTLGLSLVRAMAEQIDGVIGIKRGKGTTVTIRFRLTA